MKRGTDYIGVGVGAILINNEGKVFITQRGEKAQNEKGTWEIPGGSVELGETLEQALKREMKEEYDVEIELIELLGVFDHIIPEDNQHWVSPSFICKLIRGTPTIIEPEKCAAIGWFSLAEAKRLPLSIITKNDIALLEKKFPSDLRIPSEKL